MFLSRVITGLVMSFIFGVCAAAYSIRFIMCALSSLLSVATKRVSQDGTPFSFVSLINIPRALMTDQKKGSTAEIGPPLHPEEAPV